MCGSSYVCSRERQEREAMTRHSVGGERFDGRLAGEVWMQLMPMHWRRTGANMLAGGDDAIVRGDVAECMWSCQDGFDH